MKFEYLSAYNGKILTVNPIWIQNKYNEKYGIHVGYVSNDF